MPKKAELKARLTLDKALYDRALKSATAAAKSFQRATADAAKTGVHYLEIATIAASAALVYGVKKAYDLGSEMSDLRDKTGIAVDQLLILRQAAKDNGLEDISGGIKKMQVNIVDAVKDGIGPASKALRVLGLDGESMIGKLPTEQLALIGARINAIESPALRAAEAVALFGREGTSMLPLFADTTAIETATKSLGMQARVLGYNATRFDAVSDRLGRVGSKMQGFFVGIAASILPAMEAATKKLDAIDLTGKGIKFGAAIESGAEVLVGAFKDPETALSGFTDYLKGGMMRAADLYFVRVKQNMSETWGMMIEGGKRAATYLETGLQNAFTNSVAFFRSAWDSGTGSIGDHIMTVVEIASDYLKGGMLSAAGVMAEYLPPSVAMFAVDMIDGMEKAVRYLQAGMQYATQQATDFFASDWQGTITRIAGDLKDKVGSALTAGLERVQSFFSGDNLTGMKRGMANITADLLDGISMAVSALDAGLEFSVNRFMDRFHGSWVELLKFIGNGLLKVASVYADFQMAALQAAWKGVKMVPGVLEAAKEGIRGGIEDDKFAGGSKATFGDLYKNRQEHSPIHAAAEALRKSVSNTPTVAPQMPASMPPVVNVPPALPATIPNLSEAMAAATTAPQVTVNHPRLPPMLPAPVNMVPSPSANEGSKSFKDIYEGTKSSSFLESLKSAIMDGVKKGAGAANWGQSYFDRANKTMARLKDSGEKSLTPEAKAKEDPNAAWNALFAQKMTVGRDMQGPTPSGGTLGGSMMFAPHSSFLSTGGLRTGGLESGNLSTPTRRTVESLLPASERRSFENEQVAQGIIKPDDRRATRSAFHVVKSGDAKRARDVAAGKERDGQKNMSANIEEIAKASRETADATKATAAVWGAKSN